MDQYRVSLNKACLTVQLHKSVWYYKAVNRDDTVLCKRMRDIASVRIRYGFRRICTLLKREGWQDNHKRIYRLYCQEGLNLRSKRPKRNKSTAHRLERPHMTRMHQLWSMDFVADQLFDGRKFRALTIVDNYTRKCLAIHVGQSIKGEDVSMVVQRVCIENCAFPERIQVDNGSEFISRALDKWAYDNKVTLDFSRPGKPTDNPFIESFNGSFRDECLNTNWFLSLEDAQDKITHWKTEYNTFRPHSSLSDLTPDEFISKIIQNTPDFLF